MKKYIKAILVSLGALLIVGATILGTVAYLTDTAEVTNTFTVGKVDLKLDEAVTDQNGKVLNGRTEEGNEYHLIPGVSYTKDPTVTVVAGSESSYVRMILTVYNASAVQAIIDTDDNLDDFADLFDGWDETVWIYNGFEHDADANTIAFEFRYKEMVSGYDAQGQKQDVVLDALFDAIIVPAGATGEQLAKLYEGGFKMTARAEAIQDTGFESEEAAWTAFANA